MVLRSAGEARAARDAHAALRRAVDACQQPDGAGLARPAGADEPKNLPLPHVKAKVLHQHLILDPLGHMVHLDHRRTRLHR